MVVEGSGNDGENYSSIWGRFARKLWWELVLEKFRIIGEFYGVGRGSG